MDSLVNQAHAFEASELPGTPKQLDLLTAGAASLTPALQPQGHGTDLWLACWEAGKNEYTL